MYQFSSLVNNNTTLLKFVEVTYYGSCITKIESRFMIKLCCFNHILLFSQQACKKEKKKFKNLYLPLFASGHTNFNFIFLNKLTNSMIREILDSSPLTLHRNGLDKRRIKEVKNRPQSKWKRNYPLWQRPLLHHPFKNSHILLNDATLSTLLKASQTSLHLLI